MRIGESLFYGTVSSFHTLAQSSGGGDANGRSYLARYEFPSVQVSLSATDTRYNGNYCHSTVSESYGSTKALIYNTSSSRQRVVTHTFESGGKILRNYSILYDYDKHCALWCAYAANSTTYKDNDVGRHEAWDYDPAIPQQYQPCLTSSYSGYTRGHQVASSDRQTTTSENKQTFYYSNMTPQNSSLNSGVWARLESSVQALASRTSGSDTLYVVTGPLFKSGYKTTTDRTGESMPVPTHYYKCIMKCSFDASGNMISAKGAAYLFEHSASASRQEKTIDEIESLSGFDFFANVPPDIQTSAESVYTNLF